MAFLNWKTIIYMFTVILVNSWVHIDGSLIVKPQDTQVLAGQVTTLNCSTSSKEDVHWYYGTNYVYAGRKLVSPYNNNRLKIEVYQNDGATSFNLVFLSAKPEDAGTYICRDNQGSGEMSSAEMTVFAPDGNGTCQSNMKPDGVVIPNDCNIDPDEVQLSCGATFYGNNPPQLEWKKVPNNDSTVVNTECQTINNRIMCNASIVGDRQMNRSSYECQTVVSSPLNIKLCTIEVKNLIYALNGHTVGKSSIGNNVQCNPDTSQLCNYKWKHSGIVVSTSRTMTPDKPGLYQCEAECNIRGKRCVIFDYADISDDAQNLILPHSKESIDSKSSSTVHVYYIAGICALFLLLVIAAICVFRKRNNNRHQQLPHPTFSGNASDLKLTPLDDGTRQEQDMLMQPSEQIDPSTDEPKLTRTLIPKAAKDEKKAVFGLTILGNELFVLSYDWPTIEVFGDLQTLDSKREFLLTGHQLELPWGMQSSSRYNWLYIVDKKRDEKKNAEIVKIDVNGKVQTKWTTDCFVCRLSVTTESEVIATSLEDLSIRHYSHDGKLIRVIELPTDIVSPWVTRKRGEDEYITSYGNWGDSRHGVCVIDKNDKIKDHFGREKGQSNDQLNVPVHMTAFSDGHILVADKNNSRVVLLSPDLKFLTAIFTPPSERFPNRLCLDEKNKRLFVSDNRWINNTKPWNDGRVLVFDMSNVYTKFNIKADKK